MTTPTEKLLIEPAEIVFDIDYDMAQKKMISLTSQSKRLRTAFRIMLTHRKLFSVDPPSGFIKPGGTVVIDFVLQPCHWSPKVANKNRMLVQSLDVLPEDPNNILELFNFGVAPLNQKVYIHLPSPPEAEGNQSAASTGNDFKQ